MAGRRMNEAIPEAQFDRIQRGLLPIPEDVERRPDPVAPKIDGRIPRSKLAPDEIAEVKGVRRTVKNSEGFRFIGFDLSITHKDGSVLAGWLAESDLNWLRDNSRGRLELDNISP